MWIVNTFRKHGRIMAFLRLEGWFSWMASCASSLGPWDPLPNGLKGPTGILQERIADTSKPNSQKRWPFPKSPDFTALDRSEARKRSTALLQVSSNRQKARCRFFFFSMENLPYRPYPQDGKCRRLKGSQ